MRPHTLPPCGLLLLSGAMRCLVLAAALGAASAGEYFGEDSANVELLTSDNFEEMVLESSDYWLVEFYAPWCGHCQKLAPEWLDAAKRLKDDARLGAVDCTGDDKELCGQYGVKGFPTIKVFGSDKKSPTAYDQAREADAIEAFVKGEAAKGGDVTSSKLVPEISYVGMYDFLHTLKPKLPKVLLFPGEKGVPSWLKMLASSFKTEREEEERSYKQGKVTNTKKVKKNTPTIMFGAAASGAEDKGAAQIAKRFKVEDDARPAIFVCFGTHYTSYDGEFRKDELKEFLDEYVGMAVPKAEDLPEGEWDKLPTFPEQATPKVQVKKKSLTPLTADNLYTTCLKGTACLLLIGDGGDTGADVLDGLSSKYKHDKFNFAQVDGSVQSDFAEQLGGAGPSLVCIKGKRDKRMRYARLAGDLSSSSAENWVDRILGGDAKFTKISELEMMDEAQLKMDSMMDEDDSGDL